VRLLPRRRRIVTGPVTFTLGPTGPTGPAAVEDEIERARKRNATTDSRLREWLGYGAIAGAGLQLASANVAFYLYAIHKAFDIPPEVIIGWLTATVAQVVGIVLVIAKYLFPEGGPKES
jgi:hypothetical protein